MSEPRRKLPVLAALAIAAAVAVIGAAAVAYRGPLLVPYYERQLERPYGPGWEEAAAHVADFGGRGALGRLAARAAKSPVVLRVVGAKPERARRVLVPLLEVAATRGAEDDHVRWAALAGLEQIAAAAAPGEAILIHHGSDVLFYFEPGGREIPRHALPRAAIAAWARWLGARGILGEAAVAQLEASFGGEPPGDGLGLHLELSLEVTPGIPAALASRTGLQPGDRVIEVGGGGLPEVSVSLPGQLLRYAGDLRTFDPSMRTGGAAPAPVTPTGLLASVRFERVPDAAPLQCSVAVEDVGELSDHVRTVARVWLVVPGCPAAAAGLRRDDDVLDVAGEGPQPAFVMERRVRREGRLALRISRGGREMEVTIVRPPS